MVVSHRREGVLGFEEKFDHILKMKKPQIVPLLGGAEVEVEEEVVREVETLAEVEAVGMQQEKYLLTVLMKHHV